MKTPEEIKRGLAHCAENMLCEGCPYCSEYDQCVNTQPMDALTYIERLEAGNANLAEIVARAYRQRDAAIKHLRGRCSTCAHAEPVDKCLNLIKCKHGLKMLGREILMTGDSKVDCDLWEWRGYRDE